MGISTLTTEGATSVQLVDMEFRQQTAVQTMENNCIWYFWVSSKGEYQTIAKSPQQNNSANSDVK